ncbi:nucleotidyltransferase family protein [Lutimaribacter marinistellae]|uniref:Nucleotidyltransferase family protein n=1 Tax=Lutimaribacter marinistellae TaxID=1820329 RepID=A0ABV7TDL4_9RHOB
MTATVPVMIFAAGFGTRMHPLTADRPKPLVEVAGRPLIDHALDLTAEISPPRIVSNLHYMADMLDRHLSPRGVHLSREDDLILDTGGGLKAALPLLGADTVITLNPDAIWLGPNPLAQLLAEWNPDRMDALLMCVRPEHAINHTGKGDFTRDAQGRLLRGPGLIYGGAQIMKTQHLAKITDEVFSLNAVWDLMQTEGKLHASEYPGRWCDVGTPQGVTLAEDMLANV